jgi:hypothetical protein
MTSIPTAFCDLTVTTPSYSLFLLYRLRQGGVLLAASPITARGATRGSD